MKKLARIFIPVLTLALALLSLVGCAERNRADQNADADFSKKGDVLVVYFTWSGHLRSMAVATERIITTSSAIRFT